MTGLTGRRVLVVGVGTPNWKGTLVEHDCAGLLLTEVFPAGPDTGSTVFVPWVRVRWVEEMRERAA